MWTGSRHLYLLKSSSGFSCASVRQFRHSFMSNSLQPQGLQHARRPCPSPTPGGAQTHIHWVSDAIQHLILCCPLLFQPSVFLSIKVFPIESVLPIRWRKYWNFSFNISPSNEYSGLISLRIAGLISLQSKGLSRVFSNTTVQKYQIFCTQLSL